MRKRYRLITLGIVAAGALGAGAFVVGSHNPAITVQSGYAHAGDGVATAFVGDWAYGIPMDDWWRGTDGIWRQNGTPACLAWTGTPRDVAIDFGWVPITAPDGQRWRQVVWVSCKS